jgi:hypothetical protein
VEPGDHRRLLMADCAIHWVMADWGMAAFFEGRFAARRPIDAVIQLGI